MKTLALLAALTAVSSAAWAGQSEVYHYGDHPDVAKVIAMKNPQGCGIGKAVMVYEDSAGQRHTMVYERTGEHCDG